MAGQGESELDANEPASDHKLEKARKRGSIPRSAELIFATVLLGCVAYVYGLAERTVTNVAVVMQQGLSAAGRDALSSASALTAMQSFATRAALAIAPFIFVIWLIALLVGALQARGVFSAEPLKPDFSRVNPATGLKRLFSTKALHDLWRSAARIALLTGVMIAWGRHHLPELLRLSHADHALLSRGIALLGSALTALAAIVLVFALLDWTINQREFMKKMRMSKRELKDEHKEREGDPRIKKRLRELRLAWLKRSRQLAKVRSADVLLTNPTHYAVALEYRHGEMPAPMVTARGAGDFARQLRAEAYRRAVPVVENAPLARALFAQAEAQPFVDEQHFDAVARVLRWVYAARTRPLASLSR
jgi:flagellar biosynthetic protein FlhB